MKHLLKTVLLTVGIMLGCISSAQINVNYTNLEWVDQTPVVGDTYFHTSSIVRSGNLYVTSNVLNESGDTDVLLIKYNSEGDTSWVSTYGGTADGDDYGIELTTYSGSYIYVTGAVENTTSGYDYVVLKYDASDGSLETSFTFDGPEGGTDIPSYILVDASANVYVCGGVEDAYGYSDFGIIMLDENFDLQWSTFYDDNELYDGASSMAFIEGGNIRVTGGSSHEPGVWSVTVLDLDASDGSTIDEVQSTSTSVAFLEVSAMTTDADNNLYVTGYKQGTDKDVHTVKFDSTLTVDWIVDYTGGKDSQGKDIKVDDQGNVYVVGYMERDSGGYNYLTIKYDDGGNEVWVRELGNATPVEEYAVAERIDLDNEANIYLTGTTEHGSESWMSFVKYDTDGNIKLSKTFQTESVYDRAYDIDYYDNAVYISGLSHTTGSGTLTVLKYEIAERQMTAVQESSIDSYVADELMVYFHPDSMIVAIINDKDKTFGTLDEFVTAGVIDDMNHVYPSINWNKVRAFKIHPRMTTYDTTSITRTGYEIDIPKFWSHLLISIPDENELAVLDSLDTTSIHLSVNRVELNDIFSLNADPLYTSNQWSLYESGTYPDADIEIGGAWTYETGKDFVKVGVFDSGIMYTHEDLGGSVNPNGKIKDGWDYTNGDGMPITSVAGNGDDSNVGHGTKVAGIIGAYKDNETGIAGIAGGYWPYAPGEVIIGDPDPEENRGVSLYAMKIAFSNGFIDAEEIEGALIEGATNSTTGNYGYGLDILNCSFTKNIGIFDDSTQNAMSDAQEFVFRNGAVLVAGKGNGGNEVYKTPAYAWREYWVVAVGGSNNDGKWYASADYGNGIDLVAPASSDLVYSTDNGANNDYGSFSGTSSSTAHASGVAGLMLSYFNDETPSLDNLFPDDVENLMKIYAHDITASPAGPNYDERTGYGLLHADSIMDHMDKSAFIIKHYFVDFVFNSTSWTGYSGTTINYQDANHPKANYSVTAYTIGATNNHTLNTGDVIFNSWPLQSYCNTSFEAPNLGIGESTYSQTLSSVSNTSAVVSGQTYHFTHDHNGNPFPSGQDFWWPIAPGQVAKLGYTLHIKTDYASVEEEKKEFGFTCFPNPSESMLTVQFDLAEQSNVSIEVMDIQGKVVQTVDAKNYLAGQQNVNINVIPLSNGIYTVRLRLNDQYYNEKFIKK